MTTVNLMQEWSKLTGKPCMYIYVGERADFDEVAKAAPDLARDDCKQILMDGCGVLVFDSEEEMEATYGRTVGDDGPTKANSYSGPARVYALTCVAGELMNENT